LALKAESHIQSLAERGVHTDAAIFIHSRHNDKPDAAGVNFFNAGQRNLIGYAQGLAEETECDRLTITYGHPDGNRHPYVGALVGADEQGEFVFCSGTLITPDVFLTTAHCTAAIEQFGFDFRGVTFDNIFDPDTSMVYLGTPHAHPDFPGPSSNVKDIAVVVLDEEITGIRPALLPARASFLGGCLFSGRAAGRAAAAAVR
jgi:hypothetical protein